MNKKETHKLFAVSRRIFAHDCKAKEAVQSTIKEERKKEINDINSLPNGDLIKLLIKAIESIDQCQHDRSCGAYDDHAFNMEISAVEEAILRLNPNPAER